MVYKFDITIYDDYYKIITNCLKLTNSFFNKDCSIYDFHYKSGELALIYKDYLFIYEFFIYLCLNSFGIKCLKAYTLNRFILKFFKNEITNLISFEF